jgi:thioredoxin reductase (NADPH)
VAAAELIKNLQDQAAPFRPIYHLAQQVVTLARDPNTQLWQLGTSRGVQLQARAVMIAAGVGAFGPNRPPLAGLEAFEGKSVFYSVTSRESFRGKRVVIAGGGDSAVDWALALVDLAARVTVVHRRARFRAAPENEARLLALADDGLLDLAIPYQLDAIEGHNGQCERVIVRDLSGDILAIDADILLPFYGLSSQLGPILEWGLQQQRNHVVIDPGTCQTSVPGIYAVGDIATYPHKLKLILTGFAEAAHAAHHIRAALYPDEILHFEYSTTKGLPQSAALPS